MSEIKRIAANTVMLASPKVVKFFTGIIRAKVAAVILGTEGYGIMDQLQNVLTNLSILANGGLVDGLVKQLSSANSDESTRGDFASIIKTFSITIITTTVIVLAGALIFRNQISQFVFGNEKYLGFFIIGLAGLPAIILNSTSFGILKAFKKIKDIMYSDMIILLLNFVIYIGMIIILNILGAIIYITISIYLSFYVYRHYALKKVLKPAGLTLKSIIKASFSNIAFKELLTFFTIAIAIGAYEIIMDISTRSIVVNSLGISKIGIYSPIIAWSALFSQFILPSIGVYLFPRLSEAKSKPEVVSIINDVFRLMTFILVPFVLIAISSRSFLIPLFYSKDFLEANIYLPFHFVGIYLVIWCAIFGLVFTPTGYIKKYFLFKVFEITSIIVIVAVLVPKFGLWGWVSRFSIIPLIMFLGYYIFWTQTISFRLFRENKLLLLLVVVSGILVISFRNNLLIEIVISTVSICILWFLLKENEKTFLRNKIISIFRIKS